MTTDTQAAAVPGPPPAATYRLQLTPDFTFDHARAVVPYLARLGVTALYCSPCFRATKGSTHGYDICDFGHMNPELGGDDGFASLAAAIREHGLGLVLDFVPNHMAADPVLNPWWRDVLEHGRASPFADFFDVDWNPVKPELRGKILLPSLGDHYGRVLGRGELAVGFRAGEFVVRYFDTTFPIDPRQYPRVLRVGLDELRAELRDDPQLAELLDVVTALDRLPETTDGDPERVGERLRESKSAKERLARLADASPRIRRHIDDAVRTVNGTPGEPASFDALHELLDALPFRLSYWKTAVHEINYRRFFDVNQLAGLRVEEPAAFRAMHELVLKLAGDGTLTGLRLDHIDGLFDPAGYTRRLRAAVPAGPLYVVVEKILSGTEALPAWPTAGTTGYDFLNDVSRLFVNPRNAPAVRRFYRAFTGRAEPFSDMVYDCKKLITWTSLASELNVLAHALNRQSEGDRQARDFTLDGLREALREVCVCFPVYRTYVAPGGATDADRQVIDQALARARRRNPAVEASVFDFVRAALLPERDGQGEAAYQDRLRFAMKFQQYTGPLQAKGVEDTAFYRYNVLVSLNEVGGDPQRFGGTVAQFHQANQLRRANSPHALLATATHDTKRGEDARCRIHVLSEVPRGWRRRVRKWAQINAGCKTELDGTPTPGPNTEYLFYQALVGCWPADAADPVAPPELVGRVRDYMLKAVKEAKVRTSWIAPNEAYDAAVARFVEQVLTGPRSGEFLAAFLPFQRKVAGAGMVNSLSQVVLKLAGPGAPDFYQGTELWDLSLVDPDNRRPVDYGVREAVLAGVDSNPAVGEWLDRWEDGRIKLFLTARGLRVRKASPALFLDGDYTPLAAEGERADHVVAFARRHGNEVAVAVVPRLCVGLTRGRTPPVGDAVWGDTRIALPAGRLRNVFTGEEVKAEAGVVRVADLLRTLPVALCVGESGG